MNRKNMESGDFLGKTDLLPNLSPFSGGKIKEDFEIEGQKEEAPNEVKININKE